MQQETMTWKDDRDRGSDLKSSTFRRISIHRHRDHDPEVWLMSVHELGIKDQTLNSLELEDAKAEAVEKLRDFLLGCLNEVDTLI